MSEKDTRAKGEAVVVVPDAKPKARAAATAPSSSETSAFMEHMQARLAATASLLDTARRSRLGTERPMIPSAAVGSVGA